jgi:hypothetical protein
MAATVEVAAGAGVTVVPVGAAVAGVSVTAEVAGVSVTAEVAGAVVPVATAAVPIAAGAVGVSVAVGAGAQLDNASAATITKLIIIQNPNFLDISSLLRKFEPKFGTQLNQNYGNLWHIYLVVSPPFTIRSLFIGDHAN